MSPTATAPLAFALLDVLVWFYITWRIKAHVERRWSAFGEVYVFLFFVVGIVGGLLAVSSLVGSIT